MKSGEFTCQSNISTLWLNEISFIEFDFSFSRFCFSEPERKNLNVKYSDTCAGGSRNLLTSSRHKTAQNNDKISCVFFLPPFLRKQRQRASAREMTNWSLYFRAVVVARHTISDESCDADEVSASAWIELFHTHSSRPRRRHIDFLLLMNGMDGSGVKYVIFVLHKKNWRAPLLPLCVLCRHDRWATRVNFDWVTIMNNSWNHNFFIRFFLDIYFAFFCWLLSTPLSYILRRPSFFSPGSRSDDAEASNGRGIKEREKVFILVWTSSPSWLWHRMVYGGADGWKSAFGGW